jgi:hypothetical protein
MVSRLHQATIFALYQMSVALGILLLPFALIARRVGISLPVHKLVSRLGAAYEEAAEPNA